MIVIDPAGLFCRLYWRAQDNDQTRYRYKTGNNLEMPHLPPYLQRTCLVLVVLVRAIDQIGNYTVSKRGQQP